MFLLSLSRARYLLLTLILVQVTACDTINPDDAYLDLPSKRLLSKINSSPWFWSADGSEIIYRYDSGPSTNDTDFDDFSIQAINVSTGEKRTLVPEQPGQLIVRHGFTLSADGEYVIYKSYTGDPSEPALKRVRVDGTLPPETMLSGGERGNFAFSPDMTRVAFRDTSLAWNEVKILDLNTRSESIVAGAFRAIDEIVWSPDGSMLLVGSSRSCSRIEGNKYGSEFSLIDLATSGFSSAFVPCRSEGNEEVSPLTDVVWSGLVPEVGVLLGGGVFARIKIPSGERRNLHYANAAYGPGAAISWSPNDENVTFWNRECTKKEKSIFGVEYCAESTHWLFYISPDTEEHHEIASFATSKGFPSGGESGAPRFSPDGRKIAFRMNEELYVVNIR